jgi:hypothetical protein
LAHFFFAPNPKPTFEIRARQFTLTSAPIEDSNGVNFLRAVFLLRSASSHRRHAIHTIHDIDIVVLCELWQPPSGAPASVVAGAATTSSIPSPRHCSPMPAIEQRCVMSAEHVHQGDLVIKVEICRSYKQGNNDASVEPSACIARRPPNGRTLRVTTNDG